jgi:hypothetical protein
MKTFVELMVAVVTVERLINLNILLWNITRIMYNQLQKHDVNMPLKLGAWLSPISNSHCQPHVSTLDYFLKSVENGGESRSVAI